MKRRSFLKSAIAGTAASLLPSGVVSLASGCSSGNATGISWNFDEIIDRSGTWSVKHSRAEGGKLAMWIADMDFRTDPVVIRALRERLDRDVLGYTFTPDEYYEAVAEWLGSRHDYEVKWEWVNPCPGVIASICQAYLTFTQPGDRIIVQPPVYDQFKNYALRLGREVADNPLVWRNGRYEMDFEGLERLFDSRTKVLVLCNPHNPIGIVWDRETLARLADICERHGVLVFSDEIHADLALEGRRQIPFCSVSPSAARTGLIFGSPSKAFNLAGFSGTAWCVIPNAKLRESFMKTLRSAKLNETPIPSLVATIAAYTHEPVWLEDLKHYLEGNIEYTVQTLDGSSGIRAVKPEASFVVWLDCRQLGLRQPELVSLFNDMAGVVVNNGISYGTGGEGFVRLNVGCPRSIVEEALERILGQVRLIS